MAPDLNSLPPSRSSSQNNSNTNNSPETFRPIYAPSPVPPPVAQTTPRSPRHRGSPRVERRRSSLMGDWSLNDGQSSSPGTADPNHHVRTPSLGALHQELENEQEAQVNRLLGLIRQQQAQIAQYQTAFGTTGSSTAVEDTAPPSATSTTASSNPLANPATTQTHTGSAPSSRTSSRAPRHSLSSANAHNTGIPPPHRPTSTSLSRQSSSRRSSHAESPALRPTSLASSAGGLPIEGSDWFATAHRDEASLMQAETTMVQRENQMLKMRIRELERQLQTLNTAGGTTPSAPVGRLVSTPDGQENDVAAGGE